MRYANDIADIEGIDEVLPVKIYMNSCRANVDLATIYGLPQDQMETFFPSLVVVDGSLDGFRQAKDGALVGSQLAQRKGWRVGDQMTVSEVSATVKGIFETGGFLDNVAITSLDHLQLSAPNAQLGIVSQHMVKLAPGADADGIAREIDSRFSRDERATQTRKLGDFVTRTLSELAEMITFAQVLGYAAVLVMALVLANTVFMSAQMRRAELAVLQVIGVTRSGLAIVVIGEAVILAMLGGILAMGGTWLLLSTLHLGIGVEGYQVDFVATPGLLIDGLLLALFVGLAAGAGPAFQAGTSSVGNALRPE